MQLLRVVSSSWRDSTPALRTVIRIVVPLGVVLAVGGVVLDLVDAWGSLSFLVNLISSVVTASFGVPIALVLLSRISREQAEALRRKGVEELRGRAAADLSAACRSLLDADVELDELTAISSRLDALASDGRAARSAADGAPGADPVVAARELQNRLLGIYGSLTGEADLRALTSEIRGRWTFLVVAVKTRVYETGGAWLDYRAEGWFQHCLDEIDSVLFERMDAGVRAAVTDDPSQAKSRLAELEQAAGDASGLVSRVSRLIDAAAAVEASADRKTHV